MFVHRIASTYGRLAIKPLEEDAIKTPINDDSVPITDQIEALRVKIQLRERYNKVVTETLEELRFGASSILQKLYADTTKLRNELRDALFAEIYAVQNAVRSNRGFQLALDGKIPEQAIGWLKDKLFGLQKKIDLYLDAFLDKRKRLEEAEEMVFQIEKWPRPGTLPWEIKAVSTFHNLENEIEQKKIELETANILHYNYKHIKFMLREESARYQPVIFGLEEQAELLEHELKDLLKALKQAEKFREDANKSLRIIENDAAANRRKRKRQITKMKFALQSVVGQNLAQNRQPAGNQEKEKGHHYLAMLETESVTNHLAEYYRSKQLEVERYQGKARKIVEIMRVPDLTHIPKRYRNVMALGRMLEMEQSLKEAFRDNLLVEKDQLDLILAHLRYTGNSVGEEFDNDLAAYQKALVYENIHIKQNEEKLQEYGSILVSLRTGVLSIMESLCEGKHRNVMKQEFAKDLQILIHRIKKLVEGYEQLVKVRGDEDEFAPPRTPSGKNYGQFLKPSNVVRRLVRVGTPLIEESEDEEYVDLRIPNRADIKAKSTKDIIQGKIRRGLIH